MCPDEILLTAFVDNEVPSPWKERIELHLEQCERCRTRVETYRELRVRLRSADSIDALQLAHAVQRIRLSLEETEKAASMKGARRLVARYPILLALSSRRVSVPLPLLVASALLIVFFAGLAFGIFGAGRYANQALALSTRLPATTNANIESLVSTLSQTDPSQVVTIRAPGTMLAPLSSAAPVYVIYNIGEQKPTVMAVPAQGEAK
jgi:anti-sigma factor RsiW